MAYSEESRQAVAYARKIANDVLVADDESGVLEASPEDITLGYEDIENARTLLDGVMSDDAIPEEHAELYDGEFVNVEIDAANVADALHDAYSAINNIDDPWMWSEHEYDLSDTLNSLLF